MMRRLFPICHRWSPCRDERPFGEGRRVVASPAVNAALDKTDLGQHLQERPPPHGTGDSVRPLALFCHFFRRYVLV